MDPITTMAVVVAATSAAASLAAGIKGFLQRQELQISFTEGENKPIIIDAAKLPAHIQTAIRNHIRDEKTPEDRERTDAEPPSQPEV